MLETCRGHAKSPEFDMLHAGSDWTTFAEIRGRQPRPREDVLHRAGSRLHGAPCRYEDASLRPEFSGRGIYRLCEDGSTQALDAIRNSIEVISDRVGRTRSSTNVGQKVKEVVDRTPGSFAALSSRDSTVPRQTSRIAERSTKTRL